MIARSDDVTPSQPFSAIRARYCLEHYSHNTSPAIVTLGGLCAESEAMMGAACVFESDVRLQSV